MNTKKLLTESEILQHYQVAPIAHQSAFTLVCYFSPFQKYFGTHERFTFRGDQLAPNEKNQLQALEKYYFQLRQTEIITRAVIYDNRTISHTPERIVKRWFRNNLELNNERYILAKTEDYIFTPSAMNWLCKHGLMQFEHENIKANLSDKCFFY